MTASAMVIFAIGVFIFSISNNVVKAGNKEQKNNKPTPNDKWMVIKDGTVYEISYNSNTYSYDHKVACKIK